MWTGCHGFTTKLIPGGKSYTMKLASEEGQSLGLGWGVEVNWDLGPYYLGRLDLPFSYGIHPLSLYLPIHLLSSC